MKGTRRGAQRPLLGNWALRLWDGLAIIGMALAGAVITATYVLLLCGTVLWAL